MSDYKKRARSGWRTGKGNKHQSNRDERCFAKREIRETLQEEFERQFEIYETIHRPPIKRSLKPMAIKSLRSKIEYFEKKIFSLNEYVRINIGWLKNYYNEQIEQLKTQIKDLKRKK